MIFCILSPQRYACLPARTATDRPICKLQSDCYLPGVEVACVYPAVDNETKLLRIFHGRRPPLLFLGHPLDLYYSGEWVKLWSVCVVVRLVCLSVCGSP